nr:hypothetical protein [Endozoicomonas sp.]
SNQKFKIVESERKLSELANHAVDIEQRLETAQVACRNAEKTSLRLESDLKAKDKNHEFRLQKKQAEVDAVQQKLMSQQRAPLLEILKFAHDKSSVPGEDLFIKRLSGAFGHLPLKTNAECLDTLYFYIIANKTIGKDGSFPYTPPAKGFWSSGPERLFNPSETQKAHLEAVQGEAEELLQQGIKSKDDVNIRFICEWVDKSPVFTCPAGSSLTDGFSFYHRMQSHLSEIEDIWKYRDREAERKEWWMDGNLRDGRNGDRNSSKSVTPLMATLAAQSSLDKIEWRLFHEEGSRTFAGKMKFLEAAFNRAAFTKDAYTRTDERKHREDVAGASGTQMTHITTLQNIMKLLLENQSKATLSQEEIELICQSRLIKFNPVQYSSQVAWCSSTLPEVAQRLCESAKNFKTLKNCYQKNFNILASAEGRQKP